MITDSMTTLISPSSRLHAGRARPAVLDLESDQAGRFLVAEGVVDDISHEDLRIQLREEGVSFQRLRTWKTSPDPNYAAKKARVEHLYAIADGKVVPADNDPEHALGRPAWIPGPTSLMTRRRVGRRAPSTQGRSASRSPGPASAHAVDY
jgi:hypothetical protein